MFLFSACHFTSPCSPRTPVVAVFVVVAATAVAAAVLSAAAGSAVETAAATAEAATNTVVFSFHFGCFVYVY